MQLCSLLIFRKVNICFAKFYMGLWYNTSSTACGKYQENTLKFEGTGKYQENTLKFEGAGTLYFKVHEMVVLM